MESVEAFHAKMFHLYINWPDSNGHINFEHPIEATLFMHELEINETCALIEVSNSIFELTHKVGEPE